MAAAIATIACPTACFAVSCRRFERSGGVSALDEGSFMRVRARQVAMIAGLIAMMVGMSTWMRGASSLTGDGAYGFSGIFTWAVAIIVVDRRYARGYLTLSDYHVIHLAGFGALLQGAMRLGFALSPSGLDPSLTLACLAMVPAIAIGIIGRRALFTQGEREILDSHRGRRRAKPATQVPANAESIAR